MSRTLLAALAATTLASVASGQQQAQARKVLGPVKNAGTYHVATGTWTRSGSSSHISPDAVYRNDAPSGYFGTGWESCWSMEEVMLPGPGNPYGGTTDAYTIDGFRFGYCKMGAGTVDWTFGYYGSYTPCDDPTAPAHCIQDLNQYYVIPGLPGASSCWTVTIDLSGGYEVCMLSDSGFCAPGYQGAGLELDHGGLGFAWETTDGGTAGPLLAGDPDWKPRGEGTCYLPSFTSCASDATGLGFRDLFSITNHHGFTGCAIWNGCHWFGGYDPGNACGAATKTPPAGFDFVLFADCMGVCGAFCYGIYCDEAQNPDNVADIHIDTCNSSASSIDVSMTAAATHQFTYLLVGNGSVAVNNPPGAKGSLCVAGGSCLGRYDQDVQTTGASGTAHTDIRNPASNPCSGAVQIVPGATWNFQYWHRQPMGTPATFSSALTVTFQ